MRRDSRNREGSRAVRGHWGRALAEAAALCSTPAFSGYPFPGVERGPTWPHLLVGIHELRPEPHHHPTSPDVVDPYGRGGRRASPLGAHAWNDTQGHTASLHLCPHAAKPESRQSDQPDPAGAAAADQLDSKLLRHIQRRRLCRRAVNELRVDRATGRELRRGRSRPDRCGIVTTAVTRTGVSRSKLSAVTRRPLPCECPR